MDYFFGNSFPQFEILCQNDQITSFVHNTDYGCMMTRSQIIYSPNLYSNPNESFFSSIQKNLVDLAGLPNKLWGILRYFGYTSTTYLFKFCHCVSPVRDFELLSHFLFEIVLWFWAVENLGSSHHASIVRVHWQGSRHFSRHITVHFVNLRRL